MTLAAIDVEGQRESCLTDSWKRASAESSVGGASRCLSMPSKIRMNFPSSELSSRRWRCTLSALRFSHRAYRLLSIFTSVCASTESRHAASVFSRRCRPVMHSRLSTIANGTLRAEETARVMLDFPVLGSPCRMRFGGEGNCG